MLANPSHYVGREQAYVKHHFLSNYLERLVFKTASTFSEIVYIDGFSGPWQSTGEAFGDTSFGIALLALRKAKAAWKAKGRDRNMTALLVESSRSSFQQLATVPPKYLDITVRPFNGDFVALCSQLVASIPPNAFTFVFIDPKGWRIDTTALAPLLKRPNTEIVFNFMFEFVNRAASIDDAAIVGALNRLIPYGDWRQRLNALTSSGDSSPAARKSILVDAFSETLRELGGYPYVAEIEVLRPIKDRPIYSLFYATRKPAGIEVFRDCQRRALETQAEMRASSKVHKSVSGSGQTELFDSMHDMGPSSIDDALKAERAAAIEELLGLVPVAPQKVRFGDIWPKVLSRHAVRRTEVNAAANELRQAGKLLFPSWELRKRVPSDDYLVSRPRPES